MYRFCLYTFAALLAVPALTVKADTFANVQETRPLLDMDGDDPGSFQAPSGYCDLAGECSADAAMALAATANSSYAFSAVGAYFRVPETAETSLPAMAEDTAGLSRDPKAPTPEPASLLLMATGALTTAGLIRRRLNAQDASSGPMPRG